MLGTLIKNYLDDKGIKHSFVAEEVGITKSAFSAMLSGKRKIVAEEYFRICAILEIDTDYFANKMKNSRYEEKKHNTAFEKKAI